MPTQRPRARVVLLQHPREARNPQGTARMAHLALPGSSLLVGIDFEQDPRFLELMREQGAHSVVVYPAPGARPVEELAAHPGPLTVWFIDGTWWQAKKIWQTNPSLRALPAYRIDPEAPSRYLIRGEPAPHCLSTVEAVSAALDAVEGERGRNAAMLEPLHALVSRQLSFAESPARSPRRRERARPKRPGVPLPLRERPEAALLVHAEVNGWPVAMDPRPPSELVQIAAHRVATGERFTAFVRPRAGFSPTTFENLRVADADFSAAEDLEGLRARWAAFVRQDDVWCAWGFSTPRALAEAGLIARSDVDLRAWSHGKLKARPGTVEEAAALARVAPQPAAAPGRCGLRLAAAEALLSALLAAG